MTTNRDVAIGGMSLAALAVVCRLVSLVKELYVGSQYGTSVAFEAYALALLIPSLGIAVVAQAARRGYLSWFARFEARGADSLRDFEFYFLRLLAIGSLFTAVGLAVVFGLPWNKWLPWDLTALEKLSQFSWYAAAILLPMTAVVGLTTLLNARQEFIVPQSTHLFPPLVTIVLVFLFPQYRTAELLITGLLLGTIVQSVVLLGLSSRHGISISGYVAGRRALVSEERSDYIGFKYALPAMVALELLVQGNASVDRLMSDALDDGQVAILYWSALMKDVVSGTIIASLLAVQFPHLSAYAAQHKIDELKRSSTLILRYGALILFPFTVAVIFGVLEILPSFSLGRLNRADMATIAPCFAAYAVGFFADFTGTSLAQVLMALGRSRTLIVIGIFGYFVPNILFNALLIGPFGVIGLAASTSLIGYCTLVCNFIAVRRLIGPLENERQTAGIIGAAIAGAAAMTLLTAGMLHLLQPVLAGGPWEHMLRVTLALVVGLAGYFALTWLSPAKKELKDVLTMIRERFG